MQTWQAFRYQTFEEFQANILKNNELKYVGGYSSREEAVKILLPTGGQIQHKDDDTFISFEMVFTNDQSQLTEPISSESFVACWRTGKIKDPDKEMLTAIDVWNKSHPSSRGIVYDHLGLSWEDYKKYCFDPSCLKDILASYKPVEPTSNAFDEMVKVADVWKEEPISVSPQPVSYEFINSLEASGARPSLIEALKSDKNESSTDKMLKVDKHLTGRKAYETFDLLMRNPSEQIKNQFAQYLSSPTSKYKDVFLSCCADHDLQLTANLLEEVARLLHDKNIQLVRVAAMALYDGGVEAAARLHRELEGLPVRKDVLTFLGRVNRLTGEG